MARVHELKIESLSEEAFRPFGQIIAAKERPPDFRGSGGTRGWAIDFVSGTPRVMLLRTPYQGSTFRRMERHFNLTQTFIPLGGPPAVVAVAAPTDPDDRAAIPRPDEVRAFLLDGTKGYALSRGTWHSLDRFPLYPPETDFVILTDEETAADLDLAYSGRGGWRLSQEVDFEAAFGVTFRFVL